MKNVRIVFAIFLACSITYSFSQCNVRKESLSNGILFYKAGKERIHQNKDLENGIQSVFISMGCMKSPGEVLPNDHKLLFDWWIIVDAGADGAKQRVAPRKITIEFSDKTIIELLTKYIENPRNLYSMIFQEGYVQIDSKTLGLIRSIEINKIIISDTRANLAIISSPFKSLLKEQANCLADQVGY